MALAVKEDVAADPGDVRLLGAAAIVPGANRIADAIEQPPLGRIGRAGLAHRERYRPRFRRRHRVRDGSDQPRGDHANVPFCFGLDYNLFALWRQCRASESDPIQSHRAVAPRGGAQGLGMRRRLLAKGVPKCLEGSRLVLHLDERHELSEIQFG